MYAEIKCPDCFSAVQVDHIDISTNQAECHTCNRTYSIEGAIKKIRKKVRVQMPEGFTTTKSINHLELNIPLDTNIPSELKKLHGFFQYLSLIPAVIAIVFISVWCVGFIKQSIERQHTLSIAIGVILSIAFIAIMVWSLKNRKQRKNTLIIIDDNHLKITLPQIKSNDDGKTQFPTKDSKFLLQKSIIKQIYILRSAHYFHVLILDNNDKIHDPMYPFFNLDDVLYIEQSIEDLLDITDEIMTDEIKL